MINTIFLFIGTSELFLVFLLLILFFGPKKIPQLAREFGYAIRKFKSYSNDIKKEINNSVKEPLKNEFKVNNSIKKTKNHIDLKE